MARPVRSLDTVVPRCENAGMAARIVVTAALCVSAGYGLHRLSLWAEGRGWIYYRTKRVPPGTAGMAMMQVATIFEPAVEHAIEEQLADRIRADLAESGAVGSNAERPGSPDSIMVEIPDP